MSDLATARTRLDRLYDEVADARSRYEFTLEMWVDRRARCGLSSDAALVWEEAHQEALEHLDALRDDLHEAECAVLDLEHEEAA